MSTDLMVLIQVFDGIALKIFSRSFYVLNGTTILFVRVTRSWLLMLIFWRHHTSTMRNNSTLWTHGNHHHQSFLRVRHKYWWLYDTHPCGSNNMQARDCFRLEYWHYVNFLIMQQHRSNLLIWYNLKEWAFSIVGLYCVENHQLRFW